MVRVMCTNAPTVGGTGTWISQESQNQCTESALIVGRTECSTKKMEINKYKKREKHNLAESTLRSRLSGQRNLDEFIGGGEPTVSDVEDWVDNLIDKYNGGEIKASTAREYLKSVKYYFKTVKGEPKALDHIDWLPSNDSDPGDYMNLQEWQDMLDNTRGFRDRAIIKLMYIYARRPTEVILLNKEDIDFEEKTITFNILKKKDKNLPILETEDGEHRVLRATFELKEEAEEVINRYLRYSEDMTEGVVLDGEETVVHPLFVTPRGRISYSSVWRAIKQTAERAGIEKNITPKGLRHSRATHLDWGGNSPGNISRDMLVHDPESTNVIGRYIHDREEEQVREVMEMKEDEE